MFISRFSRRWVGASSLVALLVCASNTALAQPPDPTPALAAAQPAPAGLLAEYDDGFVLRSHDNRFRLQLGAHLQIDARLFPADSAGKLTSQLVANKVRPVLEGTVFRYFDARLMPDFGNGKVTIQDAYLDVHPVRWLRLRAGKMKAPFGLERLQADVNVTFFERALPTMLAPNRDIGVELHGDVAGGMLDYAIGAFNGVSDGGSTDGDTNDGKDVVGRVFLRPFRPTQLRVLHDIGIGFAASWGKRAGTLDTPDTPVFKTSGQNTFFAYSTGTAAATAVTSSGVLYRVSPQAYAYVGPVGLLGEFVRTSSGVALGSKWQYVDATAWQIAGSVVVTGEKAAYDGVKPHHPVGLRGGYGAVEIVGRFSALELGNEVFSRRFVDPAKSARAAQAWAVGANYHLNRNAKVQANFERTTFTGGAASGKDRAPENALLVRLQLVL